MDENTWKLAQIFMWALGIQTTLLLTIISGLWISVNRNFDKIEAKFDKIDERFTRVDEKLTDLDKRLYCVERMMEMKQGCRLTHEDKLKKVE